MRRSTLWYGLLLSFLLTAILSYSVNYFPAVPEFSKKFWALCSTVLVVGGAGFAGNRIRRLIANSEDFNFAPLLRIAMDVGLGLGALSLSTFLLGWSYGPSLSFKLATLTGLLIFFFIKGSPGILREARQLTESQVLLSASEILCVAAVTIGAGVMFVCSFSPITYYDSLVYHLALPALYNLKGAIHTVPFNLYSLFPAQMEMNYLFILNQMPSSEYAINLLGWTLSLLTCAVIYTWAARFGGKASGLLGAALWWTMPAAALLSIGAYVDVPLAFYTLLSVSTFLIAEQRGNKSLYSLAGIFAGMACAIKYTGAITAIVLTLFILVSHFRSGARTSLKTALCFALPCILPVLPWLMKNWIAVGNPVFPFFYKSLGGNIGWTSATADGYFRVLTQYGSKSHMLFDLSPWRISTSSDVFGGGFDVLGDFGWQPFLFASPLALLFIKDKEIKWLTAYASAHFIFWGSTKPVLRFLISCLPIFTILSAVAVRSLWKSSTVLARSCAVALTVPWIAIGFFTSALIIHDLQLPNVALGTETSTAFLERMLPYYRTYEDVNRDLPPTSRILLLGEQRTFHLKRDYLTSNFFAPAVLSGWCNSMGAEDVARKMRSEKLTYFLLNEAEISRLGGLSKFGFTEAGERTLNQLLDGEMQVLIHHGPLTLFQLNRGQVNLTPPIRHE